MKKVLKRIFMLAFVLVIGYQQFTYADVVSVEPIDILKLPAILGGFVCVIILVVSAISFLTLKFTTKKNVENFEDNKNKDLKMYKKMMYVCVIILSIVGAMYAWSEYKVPVLLIPIIGLVISIIFRLNKDKKISNIICGISIAFICVVTLGSFISKQSIENYNKQFLQYLESLSGYWTGSQYTSNIEGLIEKVKQNNEGKRKISIIYQGINYITPDELNQLLSKINKSSRYYTSIKYDDDYDYIVSITIDLGINNGVGW